MTDRFAIAQTVQYDLYHIAQCRCYNVNLVLSVIHAIVFSVLCIVCSVFFSVMMLLNG